jgi:tol-pal system protein YbgF
MTRLMPWTIRVSAIVVTVLAGAASAQESERGFGFLEQLFGGSERSAPSTGAERAPATAQDPTGRVAQSSSADLMMRIDRLEAQIRQLTGAVEQLQYRNQQLEGHLRRMAPDGDQRSQEGAPPARSTTTPARPLAPPPQAYPPPQAAPPQPQGYPPPQAYPPPPGATPGRRGDAFDPTLSPNAPGAPRPLGTTTPSAPLAQSVEPYEPPVGAPGGRAAGAPLDLSTLSGMPSGDPSVGSTAAPGGEHPAPRHPGGAQVATLPPTDSPKDAYDLAYGYVLRKDYALAEEGFRAFLRRYPSDRLASDALYWLGESLFQRQRYRDAAEAFLNVSTKYETAAKAPDGLLRLGQSLAAMGEKEAACASFAEVLRKYPRASVSVKQGVDREQKRGRCG